MKTLLALGLTKSPRQALMKLILSIPLHNVCPLALSSLSSTLKVGLRGKSFVHEHFQEYNVEAASVSLSLWLDKSQCSGSRFPKSYTENMLGSTLGWGELVADRTRARCIAMNFYIRPSFYASRTVNLPYFFHLEHVDFLKTYDRWIWGEIKKHFQKYPEDLAGGKFSMLDQGSG